MKKLMLLLFLFGCGRGIEKPFIVINKYCNYDRDNIGFAKYNYEDKKGNVVYFIETNNKYNVGDTIK